MTPTPCARLERPCPSVHTAVHKHTPMLCPAHCLLTLRMRPRRRVCRRGGKCPLNTPPACAPLPARKEERGGRDDPWLHKRDLRRAGIRAGRPIASQPLALRQPNPPPHHSFTLPHAFRVCKQMLAQASSDNSSLHYVQRHTQTPTEATSRAAHMIRHSLPVAGIDDAAQRVH